MKQLNNTYLDSIGLHFRSPPGCQRNGTIIVKIDNIDTEVTRCGNAVPKKSGYVAVKPKTEKIKGKKLACKKFYRKKPERINNKK